MANDDTLNDSTRERVLASADDWQQRYESGETGWDRGEPSPALLHWMSNETLAPCRVLVPGCGRGHEVIELASRGFDVSAVDFALSPVRDLTRQLTEADLVAEVVRENIFRFVADDLFDAVYEQTMFCAIDPGNWAEYEQCLFNHLKPGGRVFATLMQTHRQGGPPFHCDPRKMKRLFHETRWLWPDESFTVDHPSGMHEIAMVITKRGVK